MALKDSPPRNPGAALLKQLRLREEELLIKKEELALTSRVIWAVRASRTPERAASDSPFLTTLRADLLAHREHLRREMTKLRDVKRAIGELERQAAAAALRPAPAVSPDESAKLLSIVRNQPGLSNTEIARTTGLAPYLVSPALRKLAKDALIEQDGPRWYPRLDSGFPRYEVATIW